MPCWISGDPRFISTLGPLQRVVKAHVPCTLAEQQHDEMVLAEMCKRNQGGKATSFDDLANVQALFGNAKYTRHEDHSILQVAAFCLPFLVRGLGRSGPSCWQCRIHEKEVLGSRGSIFACSWKTGCQGVAEPVAKRNVLFEAQ